MPSQDPVDSERQASGRDEPDARALWDEAREGLILTELELGPYFAHQAFHQSLHLFFTLARYRSPAMRHYLITLGYHKRGVS